MSTNVREVSIMKHYEKLLELGCFSKNDLEQITGSEAAAKVALPGVSKERLH